MQEHHSADGRKCNICSCSGFTPDREFIDIKREDITPNNPNEFCVHMNVEWQQYKRLDDGGANRFGFCKDCNKYVGSHFY